MPHMSESKPFQFSLRAAIVMTLVAGVLLGSIIGVVSFFDNIKRAEFNLHAMRETLQIVEQHIEKHPGEWPRSWEELDETAASSGLKWRFPLNEMKERVEIDFNARLEDLARQDDETFKAIRPIGPCYVHAEQVRFLLRTIRADIAARTQKK